MTFSARSDSLMHIKAYALWASAVRFSQIELSPKEGEHIYVDARPSDAIALAVEQTLPSLQTSVLEIAAAPDFTDVEKDVPGPRA